MVCFFDGLVPVGVWDGVPVILLEVVLAVVVAVVSQLLQVLSHCPGTALHSEYLNTVWHCFSDNVLRLFAHRPVVLVVVLAVEVVAMLVVELDVVVMVVRKAPPLWLHRYGF